MELKPNDYLGVRGVIECIELFDDNRTTDLIKDLVDDFLEDITNCDPFVQPHGEGDEYLDMPAFRFDVHSLEVTVNAGYPWGDWAKMLEQNRPDWILYPYNKDELDTDIAADIEAVKEEVEQDDAIPECERLQEVWDRLPDSIQMAVDAGISEEEWRLDGRDGIREALIDAILAFVRDTVDDWDRELKRLKPTGIVLVDKASRTVCGRGMDVAGAVRDLTQGMGDPDLREAHPSEAGPGRAFLTAYRVYEGIEFDSEDADLVQRWGESEGSYSIAVTEAA